MSINIAHDYLHATKFAALRMGQQYLHAPQLSNAFQVRRVLGQARQAYGRVLLGRRRRCHVDLGRFFRGALEQFNQGGDGCAAEEKHMHDKGEFKQIRIAGYRNVRAGLLKRTKYYR